MKFILLQPEFPWRHQRLGGGAGLLQQMQHPPRAAAAGATLGVAADRSLLVEKGQGLLQDGLGEAQLGMGVTEIVHQCRGIAVGHQQPLQDPADRQLQTEVLDRGLGKKGMDGLQARANGKTTGTHHDSKALVFLLAPSHLNTQKRKTILGFAARGPQGDHPRRWLH